MPDVRDTIQRILSTLTRSEEKVLRLRHGLGDGTKRSYEEIAVIFKLKVDQIQAIEQSSRAKFDVGLDQVADELREQIEEVIPAKKTPSNLVQRVEAAIAKFECLTPDLINHIGKNSDDLSKVKWQVVEHLVGELLAAQGFEDVRLLGQNSVTGADVYACKTIDGVDMQMKFYVEVKHVRRTIGIDAVRLLYGAMMEERSEHGWTAGILVTSGKIADFHRGSRESWELKGVALRDRENLLQWLDDYEPNGDGLWLPKPRREMPVPEDGGSH